MNTLEQKLFDLSVKLESVSALTRAALSNLEFIPEDVNFKEHWRDATSLAFLIQNQITEADDLLMDVINSYGTEPQSVQVDVTASVVVAAVAKQPTGNVRRAAV